MGSSARKPSRNKFDSQQNSDSYNLDRDKFHSNDHRTLRTADSLSMPIPQTFKCAQCGMIFPDDEALFKHRTRFCLGANNSGTGRKLYYADDDDINRPTTNNYLTDRSTLPRMIPHHSSAERKREEINDWKTQRSMLQNVQDMEDRILRDSQKTQRLANDLKKRTHNYNQILTEYEKLQAQERDVLRQMFNLQGEPSSRLSQPNGLTQHERNQFESLQRQNARLEHERQIMQTKLEEIIAENQPPTAASNYEPYKLLRDMKETQDHNEKALAHLRRRLAFSENSSFFSNNISPLPYISPYGKTASEELRAIRNRYLRIGGHDSDILSQYTDLERRLRHYEYYPWMRDYPEPLRHYRLRSSDIAVNKITAAQNENQRLHKELKDMQRNYDRLDSRTRQLEITVATNAAVNSKLNDFHTHSTSSLTRYPRINSPKHTSARQTHKTYENESYDQRRIQHPSSLPALDKRTTSHETQPTNYASSNLNRLRDPLGPRPYDPVTGFVIFFDFIIHFPSTIEQCRLITCLHHPQTGLGEPSQLPISKCELYAGEKINERTTVAVIATKQPVPSCPPEPLLTVVIEVQVTHTQVRNEVLRTSAWTKIPLFDHRNRLLSGRWKLPLNALPIRQDDSFAVISTLPTMGGTELHYRLVNFEDSAEQSNTPVSPSFRDLYFYPPQLRSQP